MDCPCKGCKAAVLIGKEDIPEYDYVLQLKVFIAFRRVWLPKVTRIQ